MPQNKDAPSNGTKLTNMELANMLDNPNKSNPTSPISIIPDKDLDKNKQCITCKTETPNCPVCPTNQFCYISVRSCDACPTVTCIPKSNTSTTNNPNDAISDGQNTSNITLIIGLVGLGLVILLTIIGVLAKRSYNRKKTKLKQFNYNSSNVNSQEKLLTNEKGMSSKQSSNNGSSFNPFKKLGLFSSKNNRYSTSFSMLNFECYDPSELEEELSFEDMLNTDPEKYKSHRPTLRKPSIVKTKSKIGSHIQSLKRSNTNGTIKSKISRLSITNGKPSANDHATEIDMKRSVNLNDYQFDLDNMFQGFDLSMLKEGEDEDESEDDLKLDQSFNFINLYLPADSQQPEGNNP